MPRARKSTASGEPKRRQPVTSRGVDKRRLILEAAGELLAERGYAGTSLSDIAAAAGTFAGSLYYHFEGREALAVEVLVGGVDAVIEHDRAAVAALPAEASPRQRLEAAVTAHLPYMLEVNPATSAAFRSMGQLPPSVAESVYQAHERFLGFLGGLFDDAAADGAIDPGVDLTVALLLLVGAAGSTADWFDPADNPNPQEIAQLLCKILFEGIGVDRSDRGDRGPNAG